MLRFLPLAAALAAAVATPAWGVDLPIVSIEIGPGGAVVERAGQLPAGDELVTGLPLAVDEASLEVAIAGVDTPPALRLSVVRPPPPPDPEPAWRARYAAAQRAFAAAQPAIDRADLRERLARGILSLLAVDGDAPPPSPEAQGAMRDFLVGNLRRAASEREAARAAREAARATIVAMDRERAAAEPRSLGHAELPLPGAAGRQVRLRYRVADAKWSPRYRLEVDGGEASLVRQALVQVPFGYAWRSPELVLRTRLAATDAWLKPVRVRVLELGASTVRAVGRYGSSRASESSVEAAMTGFARDQHADGSWGDEGERLHATALTCLVFLGAGYDHLTPNRYRKRVKGGIEYLRDHATAGRGCSEQALIASVLAEAIAISNDAALKPAAEAAIDALGHLAFGRDGLETVIYRDGPLVGPEALMWTVMAFKSARTIDLPVGDSLQRLLELRGKLVGHDQRDEAGVVHLATGLFLGQRPTPEEYYALPIREWVDRQQVWLAEGRPELLYFATLGLFQLGGDAWKSWNSGAHPLLDAATDRFDKPGGALGVCPSKLGEVSARALLSLPLGVYYRYTPVAVDRGQGQAGARPALAALEMPSVHSAAKGWPLRYRLADIVLSGGERQLLTIDRIPLPGSVELYAVPAAAPGAWRRFAATNPLSVPLPGGPMVVAIDGDDQAERELAFTPPGGLIEQALGRAARIRVTRSEVRASEDAWGKRRQEVTLRYRVDGEIGDFERIRIDEPMPRPSDPVIRFRSLAPEMDLDQLDRRLIEDPTWHLDLALAPEGVDAEIRYELRFPLERAPVLEVQP